MGNHESCIEWGDSFCRHAHDCFKGPEQAMTEQKPDALARIDNALSASPPSSVEVMRAADVLRYIAEECAASSQQAVAARIGVSPSYLCDVLHSRRALTDELAAKFGFTREIWFRHLTMNKSPMSKDNRQPNAFDREHMERSLIERLQQHENEWMAIRYHDSGWELVTPRSQEAIVAACDTIESSVEVMRDALADAVTMFDTVEAYTYEDNAREVIRSTASSAAAQIRAVLEGSQP